MKIFMKLSFLATLSFIFFSCKTMFQQPIEKTKPENNASYEVEYLFEHDGCKVYRFRDSGNYVYFTNCKGDVTSIQNDSTSIRVTTITNPKIK